MKNLFSFFLLFISVVGFGQNGHIKFRDVELKGPILNFVSEMQKLDYTVSGTEQGGSAMIMAGKFIGRECKLFILSTAKTKTVWKVVVYFNKTNDWITLRSDYTALKELINDRYGKPFKTVESFSDPYQEGDGRELQALKKNKCIYDTFWKTREGVVKLSITSFCQIAIGYEDRINSQVDLKEKSSVTITKDL